MLNIGVYKIKNKKNAKVYIGSSNNLLKRKTEHFKELREGIHINRELQRDFVADGENNFAFQIVEYTWRSNRLEREQAQMEKYKKAGRIYNVGTASVGKKSFKNELNKIWQALTRSIKEAIA